MRKIVIITDTKGEVLAVSGEESKKLTCPYSMRQCRPNCALFEIDGTRGYNGSAKCCVNDKMIGELE